MGLTGPRDNGVNRTRDNGVNGIRDGGAAGAPGRCGSGGPRTLPQGPGERGQNRDRTGTEPARTPDPFPGSLHWRCPRCPRRPRSLRDPPSAAPCPSAARAALHARGRPTGHCTHCALHCTALHCTALHRTACCTHRTQRCWVPSSYLGGSSSCQSTAGGVDGDTWGRHLSLLPGLHRGGCFGEAGTGARAAGASASAGLFLALPGAAGPAQLRAQGRGAGGGDRVVCASMDGHPAPGALV